MCTKSVKLPANEPRIELPRQFCRFDMETKYTGLVSVYTSTMNTNKTNLQLFEKKDLLTFKKMVWTWPQSFPLSSSIMEYKMCLAGIL